MQTSHDAEKTIYLWNNQKKEKRNGEKVSNENDYYIKIAIQNLLPYPKKGGQSPVL